MSVRISTPGDKTRDLKEQEWGRAGKVDARTAPQVSRLVPSSSVELPPEGYPLAVAWNTVPGATSIVVDDGGTGAASAPPAGSVRIAPASVLRPFGTITLTGGGNNSHVYNNPQRKRIVKLTLHGFKRPGDGNQIYRNADDLGVAAPDAVAKRIIVSTRASSNEQWMPVFAVPHFGARNAMPAMLTGGSFSGEVLSFPYALTGQIRVTLHERRDKLEESASLASAFTSVEATEEVLPRDLELAGPTGQVIWAFPGDYLAGAPAAEPSMRVPLELALNQDLPAALAGNRPVRAEFKLKGTAEDEAVFINFPAPRGAVLREHKGLLHCDLAGDPVLLPLDQPLAAETPQSVKGGLSIRYQGLRLLSDLSDPLPAPAEIVRGIVVGGSAALRVLPPQGLVGISLARVGLIGRAPEECELEAQLVRVQGEVGGAPVGPPGRIVTGRSGVVTTVWIDLPEFDPVAEPLAVSVRALRGRFFWAGAGRSLIRLVARDPDPGGRPLRLGSATFMAVETASIDVVEQSFPPALFRSTIPAFASDLFLSVDISDLTLRYRRP